MIKGFYEGWMKGVAEMKVPANQLKAAKYLAELNGVPVEDAKGMMENVYWTNHGDNLNFFGLNTSYKGQRGQDLYEKMAKKFVETGDAEVVAPAWRSAINTAAMQAADESLSGPGYAAEQPKVFTKSNADKTAAPISSKPISINF